MTPRKFPGPWRVEVTEGSQFVIKDANGFALGYVYARSDPALHDKFLTPAEAKVIARGDCQAATRLARGSLVERFYQMMDGVSDTGRGTGDCGGYYQPAESCGFGIEVDLSPIDWSVVPA